MAEDNIKQLGEKAVTYQKIGMGLEAIGGIASVFDTLKTSNRMASQIIKNSKIQEANTLAQFEENKASTLTAFSKSGLELKGSPLLAMYESERNIKYDIWKMKNEAKRAAKRAKKKGRLGALATAVKVGVGFATGGATLAGMTAIEGASEK